jgi:hypothetical protein
VKVLPSWPSPSTDPRNIDVVYNFYGGHAPVPWLIWGACPAVAPRSCLRFHRLISASSRLFRRQWEEAEKLLLLAITALETLRPPAPAGYSTRCSSKLFWWSTGIVVAIQILSTASTSISRVSRTGLRYDLYAAWRNRLAALAALDPGQGRALRHGGRGVLPSSEMSFSLWAFVVILAVVEMLGRNSIPCTST